MKTPRMTFLTLALVAAVSGCQTRDTDERAEDTAFGGVDTVVREREVPDTAIVPDTVVKEREVKDTALVRADTAIQADTAIRRRVEADTTVTADTMVRKDTLKQPRADTLKRPR
jgi:hypothetical protein